MRRTIVMSTLMTPLLVTPLLAAALLVIPVTSALAGGWDEECRVHPEPGPVLGLVGAVVDSAAAIATAPFAILADVVHGRPLRDGDGPRREFYGPPAPPAPDYNGAGARYYGPPPGYRAYDRCG
jgi:hypothetical protein